MDTYLFEKMLITICVSIAFTLEVAYKNNEYAYQSETATRSRKQLHFSTSSAKGSNVILKKITAIKVSHVHYYALKN